MFKLQWSMDGFDENVNTTIYASEEEVKSAMYKVLHNDGYIVKMDVI